MKDEWKSFLIGGKSLKELGFPKDWVYEPDMCRWRSEKHTVTMHFIGASYPTDKKKGDTWKEYIYITDKMLANLHN